MDDSSSSSNTCISITRTRNSCSQPSFPTTREVNVPNDSWSSSCSFMSVSSLEFSVGATATTTTFVNATAAQRLRELSKGRARQQQQQQPQQQRQLQRGASCRMEHRPASAAVAALLLEADNMNMARWQPSLTSSGIGNCYWEFDNHNHNHNHNSIHNSSIHNSNGSGSSSNTIPRAPRRKRSNPNLYVLEDCHHGLRLPMRKRSNPMLCDDDDGDDDNNSKATNDDKDCNNTCSKGQMDNNDNQAARMQVSRQESLILESNHDHCHFHRHSLTTDDVFGIGLYNINNNTMSISDFGGTGHNQLNCSSNNETMKYSFTSFCQREDDDHQERQDIESTNDSNGCISTATRTITELRFLPVWNKTTETRATIITPENDRKQFSTVKNQNVTGRMEQPSLPLATTTTITTPAKSSMRSSSTSPSNANKATLPPLCPLRQQSFNGSKHNYINNESNNHNNNDS